MSDIIEVVDDLHLQFRDEQVPVPMVRNLDQLGDLIDSRVKPGLDALLAGIDLENVEYAGYALCTYLFPQQRFEFQFPEVAESLKLGLVGIGMDVASGPRSSRQDIHVHLEDGFDVKAIARRSPNDWREGAYQQRVSREYVGRAFKDTMHILGAFIRTYVDGLPPHDQYNQPETMHFSLHHAVAVSGEVLLPGLHGLYPSLREGWAIPVGYLPELLEAMFQLEPKDTTWVDYHMGLEDYWKAHQSYPSDPAAAWRASFDN